MVRFVQCPLPVALSFAAGTPPPLDLRGREDPLAAVTDPGLQRFRVVPLLMVRWIPAPIAWVYWPSFARKLTRTASSLSWSRVRANSLIAAV
jgi:hypothetical protein